MRVARGFTLVEVLVALSLMALLAALAWQGVAGMARSRDAGREAIDRTMRLSTVLSQWETDLQSLQGDIGVPTLAWDGRTLRLARRADGGVQVVAWSLQGDTWLRWTSQPATTLGALQQAWLASQQLAGGDASTTRLLDGVLTWQVYCWRNNAWSNCQSTGDRETVPAAATSASGSGTGAAPGAAASGATGTGAAAAPRVTELLPGGVRLQLQLEGRSLTRDLVLAPAS